MLKELELALGTLTLTDADGPAVLLARQYATALDTDPRLDIYGPKLLAVLESLGLTPRSRGALAKGDPANEPAASPLDELRKRRAARVDAS